MSLKPLKLPILGKEACPSSTPEPWYADGLQFTCSQCGNCCTGGPGYVWISREEIVRLGEFLKLSPEEVVERYCRKINGQFSLRETRRGDLYDCVFLKEVKVDAGERGSGEKVVQSKRVCTVYPVRPLQCRTWPFWPENLATPAAWDHASRKCPGMKQGKRHEREYIEEIRDATEWPANPPSSAGRE